MTENEQRKLAVKLFRDIPELVDVIKDGSKCYASIIKVASKYREKILAKGTDSWPPVWAYYWACKFPSDRDTMRPLITDSEHAYYWARDIGDADTMRPLVTDSRFAYLWAYRFPKDRDIMRPLITTSEHAYRWARKFPSDRDLMRPRITEEPWKRYFKIYEKNKL